MGRFINADAYASTGQGILGNNMFAYCNNNPVMFTDPCGNFPRREKFEECLDIDDEYHEEKLSDFVDSLTPPKATEEVQKIGRVINKTLDGGAEGAIENLDATLFFGAFSVVINKTWIGRIIIFGEMCRGFIFGAVHGFWDAMQEEYGW